MLHYFIILLFAGLITGYDSSKNVSPNNWFFRIVKTCQLSVCDMLNCNNTDSTISSSTNEFDELFIIELTSA